MAQLLCPLNSLKKEMMASGHLELIPVNHFAMGYVCFPTELISSVTTDFIAKLVTF